MNEKSTMVVAVMPAKRIDKKKKKKKERGRKIFSNVAWLKVTDDEIRDVKEKTITRFDGKRKIVLPCLRIDGWCTPFDRVFCNYSTSERKTNLCYRTTTRITLLNSSIIHTIWKCAWRRPEHVQRDSRWEVSSMRRNRAWFYLGVARTQMFDLYRTDWSGTCLMNWVDGSFPKDSMIHRSFFSVNIIIFRQNWR